MSSISPTPCRRTLTQTTRIIPDGSLCRLGHGVAICGGSIPPLIIFNNFHHPQTPMHILMATTCGASSAGLPRCRRSLGTSYSPSRTIRLSTPTILAKRLKSPAPPSRGQASHLSIISGKNSPLWRSTSWTRCSIPTPTSIRLPTRPASIRRWIIFHSIITEISAVEMRRRSPETPLRSNTSPSGSGPNWRRWGILKRSCSFRSGVPRSLKIPILTTHIRARLGRLRS